jgi:hypothetical protein
MLGGGLLVQYAGGGGLLVRKVGRGYAGKRIYARRGGLLLHHFNLCELQSQRKNINCLMPGVGGHISVHQNRGGSFSGAQIWRRVICM